MTLIYQITDTHIPHESDATAAKNFVTIMDYVLENPADLLVLSGDLPRKDGNKDIYRWIKSNFPAGQKTYVIPGNHDNAGNLFEVFGEEICVNKDFFHTLALDELDVVFTNTGSGQFPPEQLEHLNHVRQGSVLFTHYPTRKISDGFMDSTYPLDSVSEVDSAISKSKIQHVFCGHFHTDHSTCAAYDLHVTPSPAFEVNLHDPEINVTSARIPIRKIAITDANLTTEVIYLD